MLNLLFTLDYEIHGNGQGNPYALMVEPTSRLLDLLDKYGAKLTIMADVAEILKFKEYKSQRGQDDYHHEAIAGQLREAIRRGHDVQLHLHASYFNARVERGAWTQDWSEYDFANLPYDRMRQLVSTGKTYLEELLQPVDPGYACRVFRAANWSVSPSTNVVRALVANGIQIDTSVFKYGRREGLVNFDYRHAWSALTPWRASESDICRPDPRGELIEFPIYSENRLLGAFVTPQRVYRAVISRIHKHANANGRRGAAPAAGEMQQNGRRKSLSLLRRHAWKADFNQCGGRQLICALQRAERDHARVSRPLPFTLIGHSKLFTRFNEWELKRFLCFVADRPNRFGFGRFSDFDLRRIDGLSKSELFAKCE
jgi:hypothetical protein